MGLAIRLSNFASLAALGAIALAQPPKLIEVASIKPSAKSGSDPNLDSVRGRLTGTNITVGYLIRFAYGLKDYQIEKLPGWADSQPYDIAVKSANGNTSTPDEEKLRVRELLEDRFQLATHRETKQMGVYLLVVAKSGPKLTPHNDGTGARTRKGCGHLAGTRLTVDVLATVLSRELNTDVLDRTGLPGKYDFQLDWTPDSGACPAADPTALPSFFTALQQQLGLKAEPAKGPVEILVIDRVERPSEN